MKKDQSNKLRSSEKDFTLPRTKILRGRDHFKRLFERDAVTLRNEFVDLRFRIYPDQDEGCLIGFIVKKKLGKATRRNRIKRLLREAYRLNQHILTPLFEHTSMSLHVVLMAKTVEMDFNTARDQVVELLEQAKKQILPIIASGS